MTRLPDDALQVSGLCDTSRARAAGGALPSRESGPLVQAAGDAAGEEKRSPSPARPPPAGFPPPRLLPPSELTAAAISHVTGPGRTSLWRFEGKLLPGEGAAVG